jgi:hypothetical protein
MDNVKTYEYKNVYRTKDGTIKEYTSKHVKTIKNKIKQKDILEIIRGIKDQEKLRQIKEFLE